MSLVQIENKGQYTLLTISRPEALNALNKDVLKELKVFLESDHKAQAIFITGAGDKAFVAGADIAAMKTMSTSDARLFSQLGQDVFRLLEEQTCPTVSFVNGYCLGGGFELALSCDFIIADSKAVFGLPEVTLGLMPGFGGTQRLSRQVGLGMARYMVLTGAKLSAQELYSRGVVVECVGVESCTYKDIEEAMVSVAKKISKTGPVATGVSKTIMNKGFDVPLSAALEMENHAFGSLFEGREAKEGIAAFLEKRKAEFRNLI